MTVLSYWKSFSICGCGVLSSIDVLCMLMAISLFLLFVVFFFFQAEDGIRDTSVTGVQTCALPIFFRTYTSCWSPWTICHKLCRGSAFIVALGSIVVSLEVV